MKAAVMLSAVALVAFAAPADAQFSKPQAARKTWVTGWVGGFVNPGRIYDPASSSTWDFGSAFSGGLGLHRNFGDALALGIEASFAPARFERRDPASDNALLEDGNARLVTTMLTGRLRTGGGGAFGMYLTGGAGALFYGMPSLNRWDPDLALMTGAGLEYKPSANKALFIEWGRYWTFHQSEGVEDNSARMSQIRGGIRIGF
ncbi:MAG TPA: outer membrane beta-barrel protein [Longimicrobiales bacterium]